MDSQTAATRIRALCPLDDVPCLTSTDLELMVAAAARPDTAGNPPTNVTTTADRAGSTNVTAGTVVQQPGTARWWRARNSGTTSSAVPTWPNLAGSIRDDTVTVIDGTVTWEDHGGEWHPTHHLNAGLAFGWRLKANRAASMYDVTDGDLSRRRGQVAAHCEKRAQHYEQLVRRTSQVS